MKIRSGIVGWKAILEIVELLPSPPCPKLVGLKLVTLQLSPPSTDLYIPWVIPLEASRTFIRTESEFVGEASIVFTPEANKKSVELIQEFPPSFVFQNPPLLDPKYIVFIMVDNPKRIKENFNYATAGWVAAPTVKKIINEMIPRLGIEPEIDKEYELLQQYNLTKKN